MQFEQPGKNISPVYISYMVRLWRSTSSPEWLASLETPGTHERHGFADLASFFAFLLEQTGGEQAEEGGSEPREMYERFTFEMEPP